MDVSTAALPELVGHRLRYDRLIAPSATDGHILVVSSGVFALQAPASGGTWGSITGTLSSQTDLQTALDAKLATATAASTYQPLDADLTSLAGLTWTGTTGFLRSDKTLATLNQAAVAGLTTTSSPTFAGEVLTPAADGQSVLRINASDGTRSISVGTFPGAPNYAGLWIDSATPSSTNFTVLAGGGETVVNAATGGTVALRIANANALTANATDVKSAKPLSPTSNDGAALGTSSLGWSDLFLASGGVVNFANGDVTITHSSNTLAFAGASSGYTFDGLISIGLNVILEGPSANVLEQRNSTSAQTYRIYGTYTDASNYVRGSLSSSSTAVTLAAETAGTGADNVDLNFAAAGTGKVNFNGQSNANDQKPILVKTLNGNTQLRFGWDDQVGGEIDFYLGGSAYAGFSGARGFQTRGGTGVSFLRDDGAEWMQIRWTGSSENKVTISVRNQASTAPTLSLRGQTTTTADIDTYDLVSSWVTSTHASRKARVVHNVYDTAAREAMRMEASGTAAMIGFLGASAIARPTTADAAATFTANTSGIANDTATFDGYTIGQVVKALRNLGLLA
jgi:hypothetical protein